MNTRGLMELIVLNVGLELGVISPTLYSIYGRDGPRDDLGTAPILIRLTAPCNLAVVLYSGATADSTSPPRRRKPQ